MSRQEEGRPLTTKGAPMWAVVTVCFILGVVWSETVDRFGYTLWHAVGFVILIAAAVYRHRARKAKR